MHGSRTRLFSLWPLLAAALMLRVLVPAGWMIDDTRPDTITLKICNAGTQMTIPLDRAPAPDRGEKAAPPCLFAGTADAAPLPPLANAPALLPPPGQIRVARLARLMLERARHLQPPGRGPPVSA